MLVNLERVLPQAKLNCIDFLKNKYVKYSQLDNFFNFLIRQLSYYLVIYKIISLTLQGSKGQIQIIYMYEYIIILHVVPGSFLDL